MHKYNPVRKKGKNGHGVSEGQWGDEGKEREVIEKLTVKSGSRGFDGLRLWWYNCNDDLEKQGMSDVGRGRGRMQPDRRSRKEREETDKLGCKLTRTGPGCKPLFVLVWIGLGGCSRWPCTPHTY